MNIEEIKEYNVMLNNEQVKVLVDELKEKAKEIERLQIKNKKIQTILRTRARQDRKRKAKLRKLRLETTNQRLKLERLNNIINNIDKKCKYLLENEKVIINEKTYYKQKCDDIITNFIYEELKGSDKE